MKKFVYSLFMLTAIAMLLASCGTQLSSVSISKRHYNNGYYVSVNNKHKSDDLSKETKVSVTDTELTPVTHVTASNNVSQSSPVQETTPEAILSANKNKRNISKELTASAAKHIAPANLKPAITPNTIKELKHIQAESKRIISETKSNNNRN